ncbi:MAG: hypothetical protein R3Y59_04395 [bacterium]
MKKKYIIIISLVVIIAISSIVWLCQTTYRVNVPLYKNVFQSEGYNIENQIERVPFEILLSDFIFDTTYTNTDAPYIARVYVQPHNNTEIEQIKEIVLHPYEVKTYQNYRLYIKEYSYTKSEENLYISITIEQRRYQTLFK